MSAPRAAAAEFATADEKEQYVRGMFDAIAPRYDLLNRVVSLRMDARWRRRAVARLAPRDGGAYADVGTGTGDLALEILSREPRARVLGVDIATRMLALAREKGARAEYAAGSGIALPVRDGALDGLTNAFVLRNLKNLDAFFAEARRVLAPGGRFVSLEISRPTGRLFGPFYRFYFYHVMPRIGRALSGNPEAYTYLASSVQKVESPDRIAERMRAAGFSEVRVEPLMRGAVTLFTALR